MNEEVTFLDEIRSLTKVKAQEERERLIKLVEERIKIAANHGLTSDRDYFGHYSFEFMPYVLEHFKFLGFKVKLDRPMDNWFRPDGMYTISWK